MADSHRPMRIDIVSDVVCPWCIVGYQQLRCALENTGVQAEFHWHPFELNPDMPAQGELLRDHIMRKYGTSAEESEHNRDRLCAIGAELGIDFRFDEQSRIYNTFDAHQLMHWADSQSRKHDLKLALLHDYFTAQRDVSDRAVLVESATDVGLDQSEAHAVLDEQRFADTVRRNERLWVSRGIQGVPAIILEQRYLLSGAQGVENFTAAVRQTLSGNHGGSQ
ncbi:MAG: DsbA family oxidoreductase [Granulosicoccus sp.]|nr:DsbA family oxidoreductase [Granulosicoccus sp.]